jgi:hypothetical protein
MLVISFSWQAFCACGRHFVLPNVSSVISYMSKTKGYNKESVGRRSNCGTLEDCKSPKKGKNLELRWTPRQIFRYPIPFHEKMAITKVCIAMYVAVYLAMPVSFTGKSKEFCQYLKEMAIVTVRVCIA